MTTFEEQLESIVGQKGVAVLKEVASSSGRSLADMVSLEELDETLGSIEVFSGVNRGPLNLLVLDEDGDEIDLDDLGIEDSAYGGYQVTNVYEGTVSDALKAGALGETLSKIFEAKLRLSKLTENKELHQRKLEDIQTAMTSLGEVFGFDTYEHLEMFMAAWLMKDSTCRLSGIPGTGKTTVIESAAVLLCNSYGQSSKVRYLVPEGRSYSDDQRFGADRAYPAQEFPAGMTYAIDYSNEAYAAVYNNWNKWRFTPWSATSKVSGAYLYDHKFLYAQGKKADESAQYTKTALSIDDYYSLLTNCYIGQVPVQGFNHPNPSKADDLTTLDLLKMLPEDQIQTVVAPIQLLDADGNFVFQPTMKYSVSAANSTHEYVFDLGLKFPAFNDKTSESTQNYERILMNRPSEGGYFKPLNQYLISGRGLFTDAGRNEGYNFREFLMDHFYDLRVDNDNDKKSILEEMLREIGVAKIDYEKRADEVLYGIEIRQATKQDVLRGVEQSTYEFEPVPRPIVTQPVKFFNEANRSQAGVEDAVLGLIAERKVEYRGRNFDSPSFVAWMDTNPHQKGNDLAFIDRIDMELLFKSVSLGARYEQLSGRVLRKGSSPQLRLVDNAINGVVNPLRFSDLNSVWSFVSKNIDYAPPGQTPGSSTYDALREMSYISVLFTQRFAPLNTGLKAAGKSTLTPSSADYLYASPLMDFSTTTNTSEDGKAVVKIADRNAAKTYEGHTPSDIDRVLGFRFTTSLQKLSAALAFLRGKSYVTRSEILDALPYVTAHRLGRAKSSKGEISGMSGGDLNYNNEQEWIREAVVNGYLMQSNDIGVSGGNYPLLDVWDLFYRRCMDVLRSAPNLWSYEKTVLEPLRKAMMTANAGSSFTPVHWHIATMVVENEKAAIKGQSATPPQRNYGRYTDYTTLYNSYLQRVSYDPNPDKSTNEQILFDYYSLRGEISAQANLFSDDRDTLLSLLDSKMAPICGGPSNRASAGVASRLAIGGTRETWSNLTGKGFQNETNKFQWRTYQDSIGAWGRMLGSVGADQIPGAAGGANRFQENQLSNMNYASSFSDQALMVAGRIPVREIVAGKALRSKGAGSLQRDTLLDQLSKISSAFKSSVSPGVRIRNIEGNADSIKTTTFDELMAGVSAWTLDYANRTAADFDGKSAVETFGGLEGSLLGDGIMACFPLSHAAGAPSGQTDYSGDDHLRLWVRFFQSDYNDGFVTLNLTLGVTSNLTDGKGKTFLKVDDPQVYTPSSYGDTMADGVKDSGNISLVDSLHYQLVFNDAVQFVYSE